MSEAQLSRDQVKDYLKNASSEICVLVQVETREALAKIEDIASVDGVDGVFIGPNDLSASFGHIVGTFRSNACSEISCCNFANASWLM